MKTISAFVYRNPWVYIVLAFIVLLAAWSTLITIAIKHTPERIEVKR